MRPPRRRPAAQRLGSRRRHSRGGWTARRVLALTVPSHRDRPVVVVPQVVPSHRDRPVVVVPQVAERRAVGTLVSHPRPARKALPPLSDQLVHDRFERAKFRWQQRERLLPGSWRLLRLLQRRLPQSKLLPLRQIPVRVWDSDFHRGELLIREVRGGPLRGRGIQSRAACLHIPRSLSSTGTRLE